MRTNFRVPDRLGYSSFCNWVVPDLVLRIVGVMHFAHRAFEAFTHLTLDLALFVEPRVFPSVKVWVSWSCGVELELA
jgi:hypothetical protein